ncbi:hypothetical protein SVEN_0912, partial [Streptomyces venezuelae ATCC 10712]
CTTAGSGAVRGTAASAATPAEPVLRGATATRRRSALDRCTHRSCVSRGCTMRSRSFRGMGDASSATVAEM